MFAPSGGGAIIARTARPRVPVRVQHASVRCVSRSSSSIAPRRRLAAAAAEVAVVEAATQAATQEQLSGVAAQDAAMQRMLSTPGFDGNVYLAEGDFGRGLYAAEDLPGSAAGGASGGFPAAPMSVPLPYTLCIVKKRDPTHKGPLAWHEEYLGDWQRQHGAEMPAALLEALRDERLPDLQRLAAWLCWAEAHAPFWRDYTADLLPERGTLQSMMWSQPHHETVAMDPTLITPACRRQVAEMRDGALRLLREGCGMRSMTRDDVEWAMDMVGSRSIAVTFSSSYVFVAPLVDMVNHVPEGQSSCHFHLDLPRRRFQMRLKPGCQVPRGGEILVTYSDLSSRDLLFHFGFVAPGNALDRLGLAEGARVDAARSNTSGGSNGSTNINGKNGGINVKKAGGSDDSDASSAPPTLLPPGGARMDTDLLERATQVLIARLQGDSNAAVAAARLVAAEASLLEAADLGWARRLLGSRGINPAAAAAAAAAAATTADVSGGVSGASLGDAYFPAPGQDQRECGGAPMHDLAVARGMSLDAGMTRQREEAAPLHPVRSQLEDITLLEQQLARLVAALSAGPDPLNFTSHTTTATAESDGAGSSNGNDDALLAQCVAYREERARVAEAALAVLSEMRAQLLLREVVDDGSGSGSSSGSTDDGQAESWAPARTEMAQQQQ